jgi:uncharacterized protein DUF6785/uncharacterized protein DUF6784
MIIGITYFLPLDVAFSAWFFYLLVKAENVVVATFGWQQAGGLIAAWPPYTGEQGAGAFLAVAALALWGARRHLSAVWRKAFTGDPRVDDRWEPLSYPVAVFGFLAAFLILEGFLVAAGMTASLAAAFLTLYLLAILACTRFRAEAGPMLGYGPAVNPHRLLVDVAGVRPWSAQDLTTFLYLQWFDSDYRTAAMPQQLEAFKLAESARIAPQRLSLWIFLAWPFHPAGYALARAGAAMQWVWFPTLIGWGVKAAILRYGGMKLYRSGIPFFLGLLLGDIVIGVFWSLIGVLLDVNVYMFFPG